MYIDRMIEYLILSEMLCGVNEKEISTGIYDEKYDLNKMANRCNELSREFLEPYAINSDSKE